MIEEIYLDESNLDESYIKIRGNTSITDLDLGEFSGASPLLKYYLKFLSYKTYALLSNSATPTFLGITESISTNIDVTIENAPHRDDYSSIFSGDNIAKKLYNKFPALFLEGGLIKVISGIKVQYATNHNLDLILLKERSGDTSFKEVLISNRLDLSASERSSIVNEIAGNIVVDENAIASLLQNDDVFKESVSEKIDFTDKISEQLDYNELAGLVASTIDFGGTGSGGEIPEITSSQLVSLSNQIEEIRRTIANINNVDLTPYVDARAVYLKPTESRYSFDSESELSTWTRFYTFSNVVIPNPSPGNRAFVIDSNNLVSMYQYNSSGDNETWSLLFTISKGSLSDSANAIVEAIVSQMNLLSGISFEINEQSQLSLVKKIDDTTTNIITSIDLPMEDMYTNIEYVETDQDGNKGHYLKLQTASLFGGTTSYINLTAAFSDVTAEEVANLTSTIKTVISDVAYDNDIVTFYRDFGTDKNEVTSFELLTEKDVSGVISGEYSDGSIIFHLSNTSTIKVPIGDLILGLQKSITSVDFSANDGHYYISFNSSSTINCDTITSIITTPSNNDIAKLWDGTS